MQIKEIQLDGTEFIDFYVAFTKLDNVSKLKNYNEIKLAVSKLILGIATDNNAIRVMGLRALKDLFVNLNDFRQFDIHGLNAFAWIRWVSQLSPDCFEGGYVKFPEHLKGMGFTNTYNGRFKQIESLLKAKPRASCDLAGFYQFCILTEDLDLYELRECITKILSTHSKQAINSYETLERLKSLLIRTKEYELLDAKIETSLREAAVQWIDEFLSIPLGESSIYQKNLIAAIEASLKEKENTLKIPEFIRTLFTVLSPTNKPFSPSLPFSQAGFWELYAVITKLPCLEKLIVEAAQANNNMSDDEEHESSDDEGDSYMGHLSEEYMGLENDYKKLKIALLRVVTLLATSHSKMVAVSYFSEIIKLTNRYRVIFGMKFDVPTLHIYDWINKISRVPVGYSISLLSAEFEGISKVDDKDKLVFLTKFIKQKTSEISLPSPFEITQVGYINPVAFYHFYAFIKQRPNLERHIKNFPELQKQLDEFVRSLTSDFDSSMMSICFVRLRKIIIDNKDVFCAAFQYHQNVKLLQWVTQLERIGDNITAYFEQFLAKIEKDLQVYTKENNHPASKEVRLQEMLIAETAKIQRLLPEVNPSLEFSKALAARNKVRKIREVPNISVLSQDSLKALDPELFEAMNENTVRRMKALLEDDILVEDYQIYRSPQGIKKIPLYFVGMDDRVYNIFLLIFTDHVNTVQAMLTSEGCLDYGKRVLTYIEQRIAYKKNVIENYKREHGGQAPMNVHVLLTDEELDYTRNNLLSIIKRVENMLNSCQGRSEEDLVRAAKISRTGHL